MITEALNRPVVPETERGMLFPKPTNTVVEVVLSKLPKAKGKVSTQRAVRAKRKVDAVELSASVIMEGSSLECAIVVE